ncbi:hypothetical protein EVI01_08890 [Enterococcus villorum]|uniref:PTS EIIA type-1 domain-containing protein n=2 Tax=Enterococcus villorum TaxID=112904 RepID=A0A511J0L9_9ENTE|nr:PTS system, glucose subfamily, IIA component [Enterococcus villorum ATCC 700913]EOW78684.1 hypothetical protein I591_00227 [Enterococcus villorum ATCC 700913]GEL91552.1 hypothetical protein EVI01_08890 [Enterococcus villorum]
MIYPEKGEVRAPFDGTVMSLFPTKHAIGLVSNNGLELLIHIGLDTVQLDGNYFKEYVKQGDKVAQGELLLTFDIEAIESAGFSVETPVIITNSADYLTILQKQGIAAVNSGDELITAMT